ncbi:XTP/dITP diphosphohydrolase [Melghiribacillus thermohalophilus]|uniref:dITP/XTP pyrophosphatase n=1 Tax=Melghiribacillus thermohalophilus TaxID=1324956 RepID=A0A4R3N956_9BACI|nr:XTP/dITP diphosphatase [Melghiribacillus thermohalophilus]TCT25071.1 XTP/dITP diphosphohydrolase [Melghiribacillus thermohalophilus]
MKKIILATKNNGKAKEFKEIFGSIGIEIVTLLDLEEDIPEIEETGETFEENAAIKAETIADRFQMPVMGDDSGLEIDALDGKPGVYSARYAGLEKSDQKNMEKVLSELDGVEQDERTARFVCVLALAVPGKETVLKRGRCEGRIGFEPIGDKGFGYDPIFYPDGYDQTMAQLEPEEKNRISHRRDAINQMMDWLKENPLAE